MSSPRWVYLSQDSQLLGQMALEIYHSTELWSDGIPMPSYNSAKSMFHVELRHHFGYDRIERNGSIGFVFFFFFKSIVVMSPVPPQG